MAVQTAVPAGQSQTGQLAEIQRAARLLFRPGDVVECRVPKAGRDGTISGYFDNSEALAKAALSVDRAGAGVYWTINPVKPALLARAVNRLRKRADTTTSDHDILCRRWLPIDLDARRPSGVSATDAEHQAAIERALDVREYLRGEGWADPIFADSGNGAHLLYEMPGAENSPDMTRLVQRLIQSLAKRFTDAAVEVDDTTFNASRIFKVYGTTASKGDSTAERPHRIARILETPAQ